MSILGNKTSISSSAQRPLRYSFWAGAVKIQGSVLPRIWPDVLGFGVLATLIVAAAHGAKQWLNIDVSVPVGPFEAIGAVLGLLLVLRTNAGYDRWWEARKLWGGMVNQSRNLITISLAGGPDDLVWRGRIVRWAAALPHVIRGHLRSERDLPELHNLLGHVEAARIASAGHMPNIVAAAIDRLLRQALDHGMPPFAYQQAQEQRAIIMDHLGGCERILKTPLARSSAIQVRRFILLFLASLPFALLNKIKGDGEVLPMMDAVNNSIDWLVPFFVMMVAYPLLALDRIGMELQNPFDPRRIDHLPLVDICETIERNLLELLEDSFQVHGVDLPEADHSSVTGREEGSSTVKPGDTLIS